MVHWHVSERMREGCRHKPVYVSFRRSARHSKQKVRLVGRKTRNEQYRKGSEITEKSVGLATLYMGMGEKRIARERENT